MERQDTQSTKCLRYFGSSWLLGNYRWLFMFAATRPISEATGKRSHLKLRAVNFHSTRSVVPSFSVTTLDSLTEYWSN